VLGNSIREHRKSVESYNDQLKDYENIVQMDSMGQHGVATSSEDLGRRYLRLSMALIHSEKLKKIVEYQTNLAIQRVDISKPDVGKLGSGNSKGDGPYPFSQMLLQTLSDAYYYAKDVECYKSSMPEISLGKIFIQRVDNVGFEWHRSTMSICNLRDIPVFVRLTAQTVQGKYLLIYQFSFVDKDKTLSTDENVVCVVVPSSTWSERTERNHFFHFYYESNVKFGCTDWIQIDSFDSWISYMDGGRF